MSKLLTVYGNTMMSIGTWFIKRGQDYAKWYTMADVSKRIAERK
jgi:hypothetical protein